jgi:Raf kinase inhibitor-like YbhB/YbcL family protein
MKKFTPFFCLLFCSYAYSQTLNPQLIKENPATAAPTASNGPLTLDSIANPQPLTLTSVDFQNQQRIPTQFACTNQKGQNQIPRLTWTNPPANTLSYILTVTDPDASQASPGTPFTHWILYNIPANATSIDANTTKLYAQGKNSYGHQAYDGPCPPSGKVHRYVFTLYALNHLFPTSTPLTINAVQYITQHQTNIILGQATLTGTFSS